MTRAPGHQPVLLREALEGLALRDDGWYVDATYGRGGHSAEILARLGTQGRLTRAGQGSGSRGSRPRGDSRPTDVSRSAHAGFEDLRDTVAAPGSTAASSTASCFDLGVSSPQLDQAARGFSFAHDGPLTCV